MVAHERTGEGGSPRGHEGEDHRAISGPLGVGIAQADPGTGALLLVDAGLCEITGYLEEELLGVTLRELLHPDDREEDFEDFRRLVRGEVPEYGVEKRYVRKDGQVVWVRVNTTVVRDEVGRPLQAVAVVQDSAGRGEEGLRESEERFRATFEQAAVGIAHVSPDGRWLRVNQRLCEIVGYTHAELLEKTFQEITYPEDLGADLEQVSRLLADKIHTYSMEKRYVRKNGSTVWIHLTVSLVREPSGGPKYFIGVIEDIDRRKRAEEALRRGEERFRLLVKGMKDYAICMLDPEGRVTTWNEGARHIKGYEESEVLGQHLSIFYPKEEVERGQPARDLAIAEAEGTYEAEGVRIRRDGSRFWAGVLVTALRDDRGDLRGFSKVTRDITEKKEAEENLAARAYQQSAVAELGVRALVEDDLQAFMDETVTLVARLLNVEYVEVLELLPNGDELLLRAGVGWREGLVGRAKVGKDSRVGYDPLSDEPVIVGDSRSESGFGRRQLLREHGIASGVSIVIQGRDGPFGTLGVYTTERRTFSTDDVNFLRAVANVLVAAVGRREAEEALIEVREAERSRISRDVHDEALQHILYALQEIDTGRSLSGGGEKGSGLGEIADALRRSVAGLRAAIFDLALPGGDEDEDFVEQLGSLVKRNRRNSPEVEIELSVEGDLPQSLGRRMEVELRRVVQEALTNARRHSGASRVSVTVGASGGKLWAEVEDDGRGFGPEVNAGMGTRGMRERARALGGALTVESEPSKGTRVRFEAPLRRDRQKRYEEEVRVLLVEDHASFREAVASIFEGEPEFTVMGQAGSLAGAREMLDRRVDVAVVDLGLPDGYGGDLIKDLRKASPQAQALVLSASLDRMEVARAVESGAAGVLHKSDGMDEVLAAVRRLWAGETLLPTEEVVELLRFAGAGKEREYEAQRAIAQLTEREKEVLQALAEGLDGREIAARLTISDKTERNHMASIFAKLGVHSRLQALVFALRHRVVEVR